MLVRFWGTRGSIPVAPNASVVQRKIARALLAAEGRRFAGEAEALAFAAGHLDFADNGSYGGATSCVEIESGGEGFVVCDMGSGLRDFGVHAARRCRQGHARTYAIFLSHLHWDHIMGFPFFDPAFDPGATIRIYSGHPDAETALRRQQEEISFPVPFDALRARILFETLEPGRAYAIDGLTVSMVPQYHSHTSYGYRFEKDGRAVCFSTDAEHRLDDMADEQAFRDFFRAADLVVADTMYSLEDSVTLKADWGHSSAAIVVDLCHGAGARRLALFHHEPTCDDEAVRHMHREAIAYEAAQRGDRPALDVLCAYDGLEIEV